jgi:parvulin-like peptidyl-prolyl isomerase
MSDLRSVVVATVHGAELSLHELLHTLKLKGQLPGLIAAAVVDKVIADTAKKAAITVSDEELQKAADAFRMSRGLSKAADTQRWLAQNRLATADLEEGLQRDLLRQKVADKVVSRAQVEQYFAQHRAQFDRARLRYLEVDKQGIAQELLSRVQEEGADFTELARQHSTMPRAGDTGGNPALVSRAALPAAVAAAVFSAQSGAVVGPLKTDAGHVLILVEEILPGELDAAAVRQTLFRNWISQQLQNGKVEVKLEV